MCLNRLPPSGGMALIPQGLVLGACQEVSQSLGTRCRKARLGAEKSRSLRRSAEDSPGSAERIVGAVMREVLLVKDLDPKYQGEGMGTGGWTLWGCGCELRFGSGVIRATGRARRMQGCCGANSLLDTHRELGDSCSAGRNMLLAG